MFHGLHKNIKEYSKSIRTFQKKWNLKPHHFKPNKNYKPKVICTNKQNEKIADSKILGQLINTKTSSVLLNTSRFSKLKNLKLLDKILPVVTVVPIVCSAVIKRSTQQSTVVLNSEKLASNVSNTTESTVVASSDFTEQPSTFVSDSSGESTFVSDSSGKSTFSSDTTSEVSETFSATNQQSEQAAVASDSELLTDESSSTIKSSTFTDPTLPNSSSGGFESASATTNPLNHSEELLKDESGSISGAFESVSAATSKSLSESWSWIVQKCSEYLPSFDILSRSIKKLIKSEELSTKVSDSNNAETSTVNSDTFETASSNSFETSELVFESVSDAATEPIANESGSWIIQKLLEYLPSLCITEGIFFSIIIKIGSSIIVKIVSPKILDFINGIIARYQRYRSNKNN